MKKSDFKKLLNQQNRETKKRYDYAVSIMGDELSNIFDKIECKNVSEMKKIFDSNSKIIEFIELLNPEGQYKLSTLNEFFTKNQDIPNSEIFNFLSAKKYLFYKTEANNENQEFCKVLYNRPFSDLSLIPKYNATENSILVKQKIVISDEVVQEIEQFCKEYREEMKKVGVTPITKEISDFKQKEDNDILNRCNYALSIMDSELSKKLEQVDNISPQKRRNAKFIKTLNFERLSKLVNPQNQQNMMSLKELLEQNSDISDSLIMNKLDYKKYLCNIKFDMEKRKYMRMVTIRPFSDVMLIPVYDSIENKIIFEQQIVISNEVVQEINKYCTKIRNENSNN